MKLGFNGTNFWESSTPQDWEKLIDATPINSTLYLRFRADKYEGPVPESVLLDVATFCQMFPENKSVKFIYTYHTRGNSVEDNIQGINFFTANNIQIEVFEAGNEEYAGVANDFDFNKYKGFFEPTRNKLKELYPDIPHSVFIAPRPKSSGILGGRNDHDKWNEEVFQYIQESGDCISVHLYLNGREIPEIDSLPVITYTTPNNEEVENFYYNLFQDTLDSLYSFDILLDYIKTKTSNKIYVTEFGPTANTGGLQNTLGYHMAEFYTTCTYGPEVEVWLKHNGIASSNAGCITPPKYGESDSTDNIARLSLYSYREAQNVNNGAIPVLIHPEQYNEKLFAGNYVTSDFISNSIGYAPYMDRFSNPEINKVEFKDSSDNVLYGFGAYFIPESFEIKNLEASYKFNINEKSIINISETKADSYEWSIISASRPDIHLLGITTPVLTIESKWPARVSLQIKAKKGDVEEVATTEIIFRRRLYKFFSFFKSTN